MWDHLQSLLTSQNSSDVIKVQTLWIIGTAVQNNPSAQNSVRVYRELQVTSGLNPIYSIFTSTLPSNLCR
jgi:hsp70-interacting protein